MLEFAALEVLLQPAPAKQTYRDKLARNSIRPFAVWIELRGAQFGVRTPSGNERMPAMSLTSFAVAGAVTTEVAKVDATGNTFHPDVIALRLHGNGQSSLEALTRIAPSDPRPQCEPLSPAMLLRRYKQLRAHVANEHPDVVSRLVRQPLSDDHL